MPAARGVFTIPHFDGYQAVLIQLEVVPARELRRLVTDAWLACGPPPLGGAMPRANRNKNRS